MRASDVTAEPGFEERVCRQWEGEYGHGPPQRDDHDVEAVFSKYAEAPRRLLMDQGFVQPFELQADPKQQK